MDMSKSRNFLSILIPSVTVFISSFCIMVLELVASRLIARHLGSSLYTWTAVIGVVLAGITIGNYLGGRLADRFEARKTLAILFILSSVACVVIIILNNTVGGWIWLWHFSWPARTFIHVCLLFLPASILLGTISPVVAKMALDQGLSKGRTVGDIYAWGAAGSIAGTFAAGYYLIAAMGTIAIVWIIAAVLLLMAILYRPRFWPLFIWAVIFGCALTMGMAPVKWAKNVGETLALREKADASLIYEDESQYCYIAVKRLSDKPDKRQFVQDRLKHSEMIMGNVNDLQYFYTIIFAGITRQLSQNKEKLSVMHIGGGGYVFPRYIEKNWPGSRNDVAEIDPRVTEAAIQAFGLDRNTTINTITMDARNYVDELLEKQRKGEEIPRYDFIYGDAFSDYSVPFQLVTKEFNDKIAKILKDDGVYMVNLIDTYASSQFLGAVVNTFKETFDYVYVITEFTASPLPRDTFVVAAAKFPFDPQTIFSSYDKNLKLWYLNDSELEYLKKKSRAVVLTDDYAPAENMLAPVVRRSANAELYDIYLRQAEEFRNNRQWAQAITNYEKAAEVSPWTSTSIKAYSEIGLIEITRGNPEKAAQAFQNAINYHQKTGAKDTAIAFVYFNLAVLLQRTNKPEQARKQFAEAARWFRVELDERPNDAALWTRLGDALVSMGDFKAASDAFEKALTLEPENLAYYNNLPGALELQGRYDEAIEVSRRQIQLMKHRGKEQAIAEIQKYIELLEYEKSKQEK
jgi:tetratricopeptide (TPR) repeat protein